MLSGAEIARVLVRRFPELAGRVRADALTPRRQSSDYPTVAIADSQFIATILGLVQYRNVEDTVASIAQQILDLQRRQNWRRVVQS